MTPTVLHGDVLDVLPTLADASVDAVVCDPPYGLEFMGEKWDAPWSEPGINADAGFSQAGLSDGYQRLPRPSFTGSTNPQCLNCRGNARGRRDGTALRRVCVCDSPRFPNVRAVEMRAFQEWCEAWAAECLRVLKPGGHLLAFGGTRTVHRLTSGIEDAGFEIRDGIDWLYGQGFPKSLNVGEGRGTALKPAREPIVVARKPLAGTVAANVQQYGTGAINIDASRIEGRDRTSYGLAASTRSQGATYGAPSKSADFDATAGRWPTNVIMSHAGDDDTGDACADGCVPGCAVAELDAQSGISTSSGGSGQRSGRLGYSAPSSGANVGRNAGGLGDTGGASRFYPVFRYQAKAPTRERPKVDGVTHSTVKPLALMRWLVRLVTPPGGHVLDPFAGSGTTVEACLLEGFTVTAVEKHGPYLPLIDARIARVVGPTT